jgi:four helix bundle protein
MVPFKNLHAFKKAYQLAMDIFQVTKRFPKEELYSLTDQIRRSSRSVCSKFAEAFSRTDYPNYFLSKLYDCQSENAETRIWLDFATDCGYITSKEYNGFVSKNEEVGKLLSFMISNPQKFTNSEIL